MKLLWHSGDFDRDAKVLYDEKNFRFADFPAVESWRMGARK